MPKNKLSKRIISVCAAALTLFAACAFPLAAGAYEFAVGNSLNAVLDGGEHADIFYDFNDGTANGFAFLGDADGDVVSEYDNVRADRVAVFDIGVGDGNAWEGIKIEYENFPDLFYYKKFVYSCKIGQTDADNVKYYTKAVFFSGADKKEYTAELVSENWNTVCFDISGITFGDKITEIEILFAAKEKDENSVPARVKVDDIGFAAKADKTLVDNFMSDAYFFDGGTLSESEKSLILNFEKEDASLSGNIFVRNEADKNAFRMIMENRSECGSVTLFYSDAEDDFSKEKSVTLTAKKEKCEYVFEIKSGEHPSKIKLAFEGAKEGEAEIYSLSMISLSSKRDDIAGNISSVKISDDKKYLTVKGTVDYKTAVNYKKYNLALYRLNCTENEEAAYADGAEPIAVISMTSKFEFHIPITDTLSVWEKYVVRVYSDKDEIPFVPIDYAKYIENYDIYALGGALPSPASPKGIQSGNGFLVESTNSSHIVENVYLDEIKSEKSAGYLHSVNGKYYYYRKEYIDLLDKKIKQYYDAGSAVYIRILCRDADGNFVSPVSLEDRLFTVSAIDFLCSRYSESGNGKIAGLILGKKIDLANKYNYMGALSLDEYVKNYVRLFYTVYNTAKQSNGNLKIYIPISDVGEKERFSEKDLYGEAYDKDSLVKSLCREIGHGGTANWNLFYENEESENTLSNTAELAALLRKCDDEYLSAPVSVAYFFEPKTNSESLSAEYAYLYYKLKFENNADAFVISLSELEKNENFNGRELANMIKYIDTACSSEISESVLAALGADDWSELVSGYNKSLLESVKLKETELSEKPDGEEFKGKIDLWDFSAAHSSLGWDVGSGCDLTRYGEDETGTFLYSEFSGVGGEDFSSIIYSYENPMDFSKFPITEFELAVNSAATAETLDVRITFAGEKGIFEANGKVQNGQICNLFADLSDFSEKDGIKYIRIQLKGTGKNENLRIYRITGHSTEYDDAELLEAFENGTNKQNTPESKPFNSMWIVIIATVVIISVAVFIRLTKKENQE